MYHLKDCTHSNICLICFLLCSQYSVDAGGASHECAVKCGLLVAILISKGHVNNSRGLLLQCLDLLCITKNSFHPGIVSRPGLPKLLCIFCVSCRFLIISRQMRCFLSLPHLSSVLLLPDPSLSDVPRTSPSCCHSVCPLVRTIIVRHIF